MKEVKSSKSIMMHLHDITKKLLLWELPMQRVRPRYLEK